MLRVLLFSLLLLFAGCSRGTYQVPKQDYQAKVQVLGVLPLLSDPAAPFTYPQKEALFDLLSRSSAGKHDLLVERLRKKKGYFDVRPLSLDPETTGRTLLAGTLPPDAIGRPQGYRFDPQVVAELTERNVVDALLVVVFTGAQIEERRRSRTLLESLKTSYNDIVATATVVDRNGEILWHLSGDDTFRALQLQYADFDEAHYNRTDSVQLKFIALSGLDTIVSGKSADAKNASLAPLYDDLFDRVVSGISPSLLESL